MRRGTLRPTAKRHLRNDKQVQTVQVVGVSSGEDGIGATQIAVDIADLGRKLQTPNPHLGFPLASCGSISQVLWLRLAVSLGDDGRSGV